jgi:hypothetical protein
MALNCDPLRERTLLQSLAKFVYFQSYEFNFRLVLQLAEEVSPAKALLGTGELFEVYCLRCCSPRIVRFLTKCLSQKLIASEKSIDQIIHEMIIPFWFYCVTMVQTLFNKYGHQLFMLTLTLQFHGLSRFGLNILGLCGMASSIRTFDRWRTSLLQKYDLKMQVILNTKSYCYTWDNYSHVYRNARLTKTREFIAANANYTVFGLSVMENVVDMKIKETGDDEVIEAIPPLKSDLEKHIVCVIKWTVKLFLDISNQTSRPYCYWEIAKEVKNKSGSIPLMPNPNRNDEDDEVRNNIRMMRYYPLGASQQNSSSTEGHANLVAQFLKETRPVVVTRLEYIPLRVDIAIFKSFLMVRLFFVNLYVVRLDDVINFHRLYPSCNSYP